MKKAVITTSWDDSSSFDLKLKNLLKRYDTPATFYIPIRNVERKCACARLQFHAKDNDFLEDSLDIQNRARKFMGGGNFVAGDK